MAVFSHIALTLRDILLAVFDAATGRRRRRYQHWVRIAAPRETVWRMLRSHDITFTGLIPVRILSEPAIGRPGVERVRLMVGDRMFVMMTRIAAERAPEGILYEVLREGTDPALMDGTDDFVGFTLTEVDGGTDLGLTREMTVTSRFGRITVPFGLRSGSQRYKRKAEELDRALRWSDASPS
jgi:uncharacterized protein YndB with AHSA1/START domain